MGGPLYEIKLMQTHTQRAVGKDNILLGHCVGPTRGRYVLLCRMARICRKWVAYQQYGIALYAEGNLTSMTAATEHRL